MRRQQAVCTIPRAAVVAPANPPLVAVLFLVYGRHMDVDRAELESLIAEALMRDRLFRPARRHWVATHDDDARRARVCAAAIVTFLHACGLRWTRLPSSPTHRTPGE